MHRPSIQDNIWIAWQQYQKNADVDAITQCGLDLHAGIQELLSEHV